MKTLRKKGLIVPILAVIGIFALIYGGWTVYQQHVAQQQEQSIRYGPPPSGLEGLNKPSEQPPPQ